MSIGTANAAAAANITATATRKTTKVFRRRAFPEERARAFSRHSRVDLSGASLTEEILRGFVISVGSLGTLA